MNIWSEEFEGAITICDREGIITYMNDASKKQFMKYGGADLLGTNLLECHPEPSRSKLTEMLKTASTNTYTTEKAGLKKIIHQSPLYENGIFSGLIEMSFEIPHSMPHHIRD